MARRGQRLRMSHHIVCALGGDIDPFRDPMTLDPAFDAVELPPEQEALEIVSRFRGGDDE